MEYTERKALFFDIDGTLYQRDNPMGVPESTREALKRLQLNGHYTFICTGRMSCAVEPALRGLGFNGMIFGCGTLIELHNKLLYYRKMERFEVLELQKIGERYGALVILEGRDFMYCKTCMPNSEFYNYYKIRKGRFGPIWRSDLDSDWEISKITVLFPEKDRERKERIVKEASAYADVIDAGSSAELVPKGHSKASGMAFVLKELGLKREASIAFGDNRNDLEMLNFAGRGIAMGNSSPEILKNCREHTDSVYEDGIFNSCRRLGLI